MHQRRGDSGEQRREVVGTSVGQVSFGMAPHPFVGIQLGRIGREIRHAEAAMAGEERPQHRTLVNMAVIPQHDDGTAQLAQEVTEKRTRVGRANVVSMDLEVESTAPPLGAQRHARDHGEAIMPLPMPQDRRVSAWCPRAPHRRNQQEPRLVDEDEMGAQPRGVFFSRGQAVRFQAAMAASSRCSARRSGFCGVQPN